MKVRDHYLAKAQTLTDSGTVTIPLTKGMKIQDIRIKVGATNGATSNTVGKLCGLVSKIEILDGSDVWHSVSMREEQAINCYQNYLMPRKELSGGAGVVIFEESIVCFGRWFRDRDFYLDTSRLSNPQLRITYAFAVSATAGIATGTGTLSAIARLIEDGAPPYKGCVMAKELKSWTTAASGDESTLLPTDWPYVALLISALKTTVDPTTILTNIKLQRDAGRFTDVDMTGVDLAGHNVNEYGYFEESFRPLKDTAATWLADLFYKTGAWYEVAGATGKAIATTVTGESIVSAFTTGETVDLMTLKVRGAMPHAAWYLPIGNGKDPDDFLSVQGLSELKLILTQGVASAAGTIVSLQVRQ